MEKLDDLRDRVKKIDRNLINLIGQRIRVTEKIGARKKKDGVPLRNWDVEKSVIENAVESARRLDLPPPFIKAIMQKLIDASRFRQEMLHYSTYTGGRKNILIVGGLGVMGRWFADFFQNQGHEVTIYDVRGRSSVDNSRTSLERGMKDAAYVLIATPLEVIPRILDEITRAKFKGVVFDIASLKAYLRKSIEKATDSGIAITSIHPMFGPGAKTLSDKVLILCSCGNKKADRRVERFFKDTALSIVRLSLEEHDRVISYVLGLSHIINLIFMRVIVNGPYKYRELMEFASTTFLSQMVTTASVIKEDADLYYEIQRLNPFKADLYGNINRVTKHVVNTVLNGRKKSFIKMMKQGNEWLEQK